MTSLPERVDELEGMVQQHAITLAEHHKDLASRAEADVRLASAIDKLTAQLDWRNALQSYALYGAILYYIVQAMHH